MDHQKDVSGDANLERGEDVVAGGMFERYLAETDNPAQSLGDGRDNGNGAVVGGYFPSGVMGSYMPPPHLIPVMFGLQQQPGNGQGFDPNTSGFLPYPLHQMHGKPRDVGNMKKMMQKRSLKMLTSQFLGEYGRNKGCVVHMEDASKKLNTSRRRMYDIMAVCGEIGLVSRVGKGQYMWHGDKYVAAVVSGLSSNDGTTDKNVASLAGLTRAMVSYLLQIGPGELVEVDCIAIKVLGLDGKLEGKTLKSKLRRAYDVASVLCALKMVRDDVGKERQATKQKRCLIWKGVDEIRDAIREAEMIDFTTCTSAGGVEQMPSLQQGYAFPGIFPAHYPGMVPGDGMGKDVVISLPEMHAVSNNYPTVVPTNTQGQDDMAQQNLVMMQYLASAMQQPDNKNA